MQFPIITSEFVPNDEIYLIPNIRGLTFKEDGIKIAEQVFDHETGKTYITYRPLNSEEKKRFGKIKL